MAFTYNGINAVAIGTLAGVATQGSGAVAIGFQAGNTAQQDNAVAIGSNAGYYTQGTNSIAIGNNAGSTGQRQGSIAIGFQAGAFGATAGSTQGQGVNSIAIGTNAGSTFQGGNSVAIGANAGLTGQGAGSIAIGGSAGQTGQGVNAIAIGTVAGQSGQAANTVVISALGTVVTGATASATYIAPVRNITQTTVLGYNTTTSELTYYATPSGGITAANTNLLYDDFMSCPLNSPTTPIGLMGMQASNTSAFLTPYTGTKIAGRCGVIRLLNPNTTNVMWDIYNSQPLAFNDLLTNGYPLTLASGNWGDGTQPLNVIQYVGVFSSTSSTPATAFAALPNFYLENRIEFDPSPPFGPAGNRQRIRAFQNGVLVSGPFTLAFPTTFFNFTFQRTGATSYTASGYLGGSGNWTAGTGVTGPLFLRCGAYNPAGATQNAYTYIDYVGVQLNTR